jgi:hypothetical protein
MDEIWVGGATNRVMKFNVKKKKLYIEKKLIVDSNNAVLK